MMSDVEGGVRPESEDRGVETDTKSDTDSKSDTETKSETDSGNSTRKTGRFVSTSNSSA